MKYSILYFFIIFIYSLQCNSQNRDNIWQLGFVCSNGFYPRPMLSFNNGVVDTSNVSRTIGFFVTNTSICDTAGNLLFYTNGVGIGNSNHDTLFNSADFNPGYESTINCNLLATNQACLILPQPLHNNKYFLFHMSSEQFNFQGVPHEHPLNFKYSVINMNLDNGLGGIDSNNKSVILLNDTMVSGFTNACRHGNGRDWWIVSPRFNSNAHKKFILTPDSVYFYSSQNIGDSIRWRAGGQSCFSPDGSKYIIKDIIGGLNLFNFDRCTGFFYDSVFVQVPKLLGSYLDWTNGLAFSPNSRFIYVCQFTKIWQYDTWASNIAASQIQVAEWDTVYNPFETYFFNMQLAPDKKIYIGTWGSNFSIHVIDSPDSLGLKCKVIQNIFDFPATIGAVPTFPNYDLGPLIGSPCDTLGLGIVQNNSKEQLEITVSPNPANQLVNFLYQIPTNKQVTLTLYDGYGNIVARQSLYGVFRNFMLHTDKLANGLYYWVAQNGEVSASGKLVVVH